MKKLNRKGFTLVELLAVIVILAIVVGITLVTVLPTLKKSRQEAFELTAQTAADFFEKNYQLYIIGERDSIPDELKTAFANLGTAKNFDEKMYTLAGLKKDNYATGTWKIDTATGRACVTLTPSSDGEYYDATGPKSSTGCSLNNNN